MPVAVQGSGSTLGREPFTVLSWNIQFGAGRNPCFFYDGGPDARVTQAEVEHTLAGIAGVVRSVNPDLVLLQEVDRCSQRTARVDQVDYLGRALGLPCRASTPYFWVPYVPVPPESPMGAVEMHLAVYSRFQLGQGRRIALSTLNEPLYRRLFNLRRALLRLRIDTELGPLDLLQTHLSAFSRGDGTLGRQVQTLLDHCEGERVLLAGDLNSLPPGVDPADLGLAAQLYAASGTPIQPLYDALDVLCAQPSYVPYGSQRADRTIDYAFGRGVQVLEARTLAEGGRWSDHLPLVFTARL